MSFTNVAAAGCALAARLDLPPFPALCNARTGAR